MPRIANAKVSTLVPPNLSAHENLRTRGESRGNPPTRVSLKLSPPEKLQGVGIVKLGEVSSLAAWTSTDGRIEITFGTAKLSPDRLRDLERYRLSSRPIEVYLTGDAQAVSCVMIAFERKPDRATFYLTKVVPS